MEDVARAFEVILHRGVTGKIYNIGGTNEKANIEVAKDLIRLMGHEQAEEKMLNFVEDRAFNGTFMLPSLPPSLPPFLPPFLPFRVSRDRNSIS